MSSPTITAIQARIATIKKRDTQVVSFEPAKIELSLRRTLRATGLKEDDWTPRLLRTVLSRLERNVAHGLEVTTGDVHDTIQMLLIEHNLPQVARKFLQFRQAKLDVKLQGGSLSLPQQRAGKGLVFSRFFTRDGAQPFDEIRWERRDAVISNEKGEIVFEQKGVEVPAFWTQTATNIVVQKYFRGQLGAPDRESSARQLIGRVASTIANWGRADGYFKTDQDADIYEAELTSVLINQRAAFNSPVWFNVGIEPKPQCSACFINSVQDDMRSILNLAVTEGMLFKYGSGTGSNLFRLRSSREPLSQSSGRASGPVSFMRGWDAFAGVIKSGGRTRRAAKMVILNADHPDILDFVWCKAKEEKKAHTLIEAGYDPAFNSDLDSAYSSIFYQNANNSVRAGDDFFRAVEENRDWQTRYVTTGQVCETIPARHMMGQIAEAAWICGDPGVQYDGAIQKWNPCKNTDRINATNPCSEYVFLDDTACNLSSINLMKFRTPEGGFDVEGYKHTARVMITAMEMVVDNSSYPTPSIEQNSHDFRPLGIGFANLGALLMSYGIAYDSEAGRNIAGAVSSILSGETYWQSTQIAKEIGAFERYQENREPFLQVMRMHRDAAYQLSPVGVPETLYKEARVAWDRLVEQCEKYGARNAQISVIAPTGTISFLMDCDTTGIEPDIALVKYKWLVGGGMVKIVNRTVPEALEKLGYSEKQRAEILAYIDKTDTIEGAPYLKPEHLAVFDCAFKPAQGTRSIHHLAHLNMMAAVQPFVSGAISKTVNMPESSTVQDIADTYLLGWKLGLKAVAIYRDGCKKSQPLTTSKDGGKSAAKTIAPAEEYKPRRRRLPDERRSITHKFTVGGYDGYVTAGLYDDGSLGEVFISMAKQGSVISGLMDSFATSVSIALQYGVPLKVLVNKFAHSRFEPSGFTNNPSIRIAKSVVDYIFRWLGMKFLSVEEQRALGIHVLAETSDELVAPAVSSDVIEAEPKQTTLFNVSATTTAVASTVTDEAVALNSLFTFDNQSDAPACDMCGAIMVRNASCYKCLNCGSTSGCS